MPSPVTHERRDRQQKGERLMPYYKREGRAHKILRRLAMGPTRMGLLARELGHDHMEHREYKRLWRRLDDLLDHGFIESDKPFFRITQAGLDRLTILDRDPLAYTSVRVFARRAA